MVIILMTMCVSYKSYAAIQESYFKGKPISGKKEITYTDLANKSDIFCRQKGTHIPTREAIYTLENKDTDSEDTNEENNNHETDTTKFPKEYECTSEIEQNPSDDTTKYLTSNDFRYEKTAIYHSEGMEICKPDEAYILSHAENNNGKYPSIVQQAWWMTDAGNLGNKQYSTPEGRTLKNAAEDYKSFVKKLLKASGENENDIENTSTYQSRSHVFQSGNKKERVSVQFPNVDIKSTFTFNKDKAKVQLKRKQIFNRSFLYRLCKREY